MRLLFFSSKLSTNLLKSVSFSLSIFLCTALFFSACDETKKTAQTPKNGVKPLSPPSKKPKTDEPENKSLVNFTQSVMLNDAFARAKAENKPIFVDFYTDFCEPCKIMNEFVFSAPDLAKLLNNNFVNYHFDCMNFDADPFVEKYKVKGYPTLIFLRPDGTVIKSITGALGYTDMKKEIHAALAKFRTEK